MAEAIAEKRQGPTYDVVETDGGVIRYTFQAKAVPLEKLCGKLAEVKPLHLIVDPTKVKLPDVEPNADASDDPAAAAAEDAPASGSVEDSGEPPAYVPPQTAATSAYALLFDWPYDDQPLSPVLLTPDDCDTVQYLQQNLGAEALVGLYCGLGKEQSLEKLQAVMRPHPEELIGLYQPACLRQLLEHKSAKLALPLFEFASILVCEGEEEDSYHLFVTRSLDALLQNLGLRPAEKEGEEEPTEKEIS